jgi:ABC-2 type transport system permease protein
MALSGTDFGSYTRFQQQAENYRYKLAQQMNELQIQYIGNQRSADNKISRDFWKSLPDLEYKPAIIAEIRKQEGLSLAALTAWLLLMILVVIAFSEKIKLV